MLISNKHLRVYTIIFDKGNPGEVGPLVYAQNLSQNGTIWQNTRMNKEDAPVLLSDGDILKLSPTSGLTFQAKTAEQHRVPFSDVQRREMRHFEGRFKITHRLLGCGAYGRVHMAIVGKEREQRQLACKIIDISRLKKRLNFIELSKRTELRSPRPAAEVDAQEEIEKVKYWAERRREAFDIKSKLHIYKREVDILKDLCHPNIIRLEKVYIFQELVTAGDLFSFLEYKKFNLSDSETAVIVRQVALAITYLHENKIVHRDIKPDNVLMTSLSDGARVVLTDFGCARRLEKEGSRMKTSMGTLEYTAPEVTQPTSPGSGKGYTKAVDMWSLGCLTVVLLTGGSPFTDQKTGRYSQDMAKHCDLSTLEQEPEWQHVGLSAKDFVRKLLILDEDARMTARQAIAHKWFTNPAYQMEIDELYKRAAKQWKPNRHHVVSHQNIDDRASANGVTFWKREGEPSLVEWPFKPFAHQVHEIIYSARGNSAKVPGKEVLPCVDIKKERRIYPYECSVGQAPVRAGSVTFSEMEMADRHRILPPPETGAEKDKDKCEVKKADVRGVSLVVLESFSDPALPNNDKISNSDSAEEKNGSRIRMPFSPDAWNQEPISVLTRRPQVVYADEQHNTPLKPRLPGTPRLLQPLRTLGYKGFMPIEYQKNNMNKSDTISIKEISLSDFAQGSRICASYKSNEKSKNDGNGDGSRDRGRDVADDDSAKQSSSPAASPRKLKRSLYDFREDEDNQVYEEIEDRISGTRRRIIYGERDRC
ncbi:CAMK protein kinase [Emergomyces pasteurianus Ep9510]|uniref:CAMK protein kinase n=1 Tax=Emergomyces pasteurianus Ep9510 TaxID=1447872 RepID=A0A1J9Q1V9_9EURO|nr:CAMK protein kinase [Emergomyces pasteurianus Ep9510]